MYQSCNADPDLWIKAEYRPEDKLAYYSYILCYADDILCVHYDPDNVFNKLNGYVPLKSGLVGSFDMCFGTNLSTCNYIMASGLDLINCQRGQIIYSKVAIALNWMCP